MKENEEVATSSVFSTDEDRNDDESVVISSVSNNSETENYENVIINEHLAVKNNISTGLLSYLRKNTIGKEILKCYEKCQKENKLLPRIIRSKLVRLIISRERDWILKNIDETQKLEKFIITKERFQLLAEEVTQIFKGEHVSTYYTPFIQDGANKIMANGKLWHHFNYTKDCLKKANIL